MKRLRDEALAEFIDHGGDDPETLRDWVERYPELIDDLVGIAVAAEFSGGLLPTADEVAPLRRNSEEDSELAKRISAHMGEARDAEARPSAKGILRAARNLGMMPSALASALGVGLSVITKLDRRLVIPETVPARLVAAIARQLKRSYRDVAEYLLQPPTLSANASYRSNSLPSLIVREDADAGQSSAEEGRWGSFDLLASADKLVGPRETLDASRRYSVQSFTDAVLGASDMSDEAKQNWLPGHRDQAR